MTFGQKAEWMILRLLVRAGYDAVHATRLEDREFKVDFWVRYDGYWLPIQFSIDRRAITGWKGLDAIRRGVIPMWVDPQELEVAHANGNGAGIVKEFWTRVEKILNSFPHCKHFRTPSWSTHG